MVWLEIMTEFVFERRFKIFSLLRKLGRMALFPNLEMKFVINQPPEAIYDINVLSTDGEITNFSATPDAIMLNQSLEDARAGKNVSMVVEIFVDPAAGFDSLEIRLEKGSIGTATLRFYTITDEEETTVLEVSHSLTNDGSGRNPYQISFPFSLLE